MPPLSPDRKIGGREKKSRPGDHSRTRAGAIRTAYGHRDLPVLRLWRAAPSGGSAIAAAMATGVARHDAIVRDALERHGAYVFKTVGDAFYAAFALPEEAIAAGARGTAQARG